ncbi:hypothetical protein F5Y17DRAFT_51966 [Xylariaceae sp. FL0594]|nr:hypothetical protein F5Y17DRAFT_51966 [Xylariaceae sp. FL0594]
MERKRKLPARAAARGESASKKHNISTSPENSGTPAPHGEATEPAADDSSLITTNMAAALPTSVQPGQPLPTVERPQPDDLTMRDFQSVQESGVMAESLFRSRQKWIDDGIFEKYWTKPSKRKGAAKEDASNPAKDTMVKIGQVTITAEPHILEATMYGIKDPKPPPNPNPTVRPVLQYGPPNGAMPPSKPTKTSTSASTATASPLPTSAAPSGQAQDASKEGEKAPPSHPSEKPITTPRGMESVLAAPLSAPTHPRPPQQPPTPTPPLISQRPPQPPPVPLNPAPGIIGPVAGAPKTTPTPPKAGPAAAPGSDPIIVTLADKASEDPQLRALMKRVAVGEAAASELAQFQKIIDQITLEHKRKQQGPDPESVMIGDKSVKWLTGECQAVLDIVLAAEPNLKSGNLRPPPDADPLVVILVREALDVAKVGQMVKRIASGNPNFTDCIELKTHMDRVLIVARQDAEAQETANRMDAGGEKYPESPTRSVITAQNASASQDTPAPQSAPTSQQALRSKGPPPVTKPEYAAVALEFAGGTGDRYLFPKYSILEYSADGTQVVASFLIVRKGSTIEYGGDPALDYYQPVTLRLQSPSAKVLEPLARVVAPKEDVQRYMDNVMDTMTRGDYVLLAMRLPRPEKEDQSDEREDGGKASESRQPSHPPLVLWDVTTNSSRPTTARPLSAKATPSGTRPASDEDQYQSFIASVS